jgi:hypothetical protein
MASKTAPKKSQRKQHKPHHGWMVIFAGLVLMFFLGVSSTLTYQTVTRPSKSDDQTAIIEGSDGAMGLSGYSDPFQQADKINYTVTYMNNSSEDRSIEIQAIGFSRDPKDNIRDDNGSLVGPATSTFYSDKAVIQAGQSGKFMVTIKQTKDNGTHYVELRAQDAQQARF